MGHANEHILEDIINDVTQVLRERGYNDLQFEDFVRDEMPDLDDTDNRVHYNITLVYYRNNTPIHVICDAVIVNDDGYLYAKVFAVRAPALNLNTVDYNLKRLAENTIELERILNDLIMHIINYRAAL